MLSRLSASDGDTVVIMDSDLQHPPEFIPQMLIFFNEGYDQIL